MKRSCVVFIVVLSWGLGFATTVSPQSTGLIRPSLPDPCSAANNSAVRIHAPSLSAEALSLCNGYALAGASAAVSARPLALAKGDFNEEGMDDLVSGYGSGKGGLLVVHRGNIGALWPYGEALRYGPPAAFLPNPRSFALPETPDFVAAGDFDGDGHQDLVTAQRGSDAFYFLRGDGRGGFAAAKRIDTGGSITAMIAGEIDRRDGLPDLIFGITTARGARVIVLEGPNGAVTAQPEIFSMPEPVTALALGHFHGSAMIDLAVGAGDNLILIEGRDRKLSLGLAQQAAIPAAKISSQRVGYSIQALESGDFTGGSPSLAALGDDGHVHILEHAVTDTALLGKMLGDPNFVPSMQVPGRPGKDSELAQSGRLTPSIEQRLSAIRSMAKSEGDAPGWAERTTITLPSGFAQSAPNLRAARISGSRQDDLLIPDKVNGQLHVISTARQTLGANGKVNIASQPAMHLLASLESENAPAAILPMRLNQFGLQGLVVLQDGQSTPTVMPQTIPASNIFTVTTTSDAIIPATQPTQYTGPAGSLRAAMYNANNATGPAEVVFNIPTSDPGYNSATGTFLIQPLSEAAPGAFNNFALPPINNTITIDGYTQPGASPNTSATTDNAKILIQIDGGKAATPGGAGLVPFDDTGSTFRGLNFTGWANPEISSGSSGETASGAEGIEANGVADYIEGNFFGTDPTGTLATDPKTLKGYGNRIGIFADNGPAFGNMDGGNIIGGTTPQARNILSNNSTGGVLFLSTALEAHLEGNFIGLDASGAKVLPNLLDGAGSNGPTITIGGTLPGDGNVISGNGTNVDFNDLTNGGQATGSIAQGNLIGTDATGTIGIGNAGGAGASIQSGPTAETVGGTTPAARNVISGNAYGVYIFNNTTNNVIQGNFIGTDVTGTKAVPNVQQGFLQGATDSTQVPATNTVLGGSVAGAGNLISGNTLDGISISGTNSDDGQEANQGSTILGNFIGTDVTGTKAVGNGATGISLLTAASNNVIGATEPGAGNIIAYNTSHGVLIDAASSGAGTGNNTVGNTIVGNGGAGVRINSGTQNLISRNSIYKNKALGIDLGATGPNANTTCNSTNTGANDSQNAPVLTAGSGTAFFTATATDPNGNTSEFSNAVASSSGNMLDLLGNFNSAPSTTYTVEFFSSPIADPSGFGQGLTYLGSTQVTTGSDCSSKINNPLDSNDADVSITLSNSSFELEVGPDFGSQVYTATVENLGPATATDVVVKDILPSALTISSLYCNLGPCQSSITTSLGNCTVTGQTVTCNLGTLAAGQTASISIPVQALTAGSIVNTATITATQTDPALTNNTSSVTKTVTYPDPLIDFSGNGVVPNISPDTVLAGSQDTLVTIYGVGFLPSSTVSLNGTNLPVVTFVDNQLCSYFNPYYCAAIEVNVPASLLTTVGTPTVTVTNPDPGQDGGPNTPSTATFNIVSACSFTVDPYSDLTDSSVLDAGGTDPIAEQVGVAANAAGCAWSGSSSVNWVVPLESAPVASTFNQYGGSQSTTMDFAVAPNSSSTTRNGSITIAGQVFSFSQAGGAPCDYKLSSNSGNFTAAGGAGSLNVTIDTIQSGALCSPSVETNIPNYPTFWITVPLNYVPGSGTVTFNVAANTGPARTGTIMIGGYVYTVNQAAPPCSYNLTQNNALWGAAGGTGSFNVTASANSCAWTAQSSDTSSVSVTSGASGTGNGTVKYSLAANNSGPQTPTITVSDKNGGSSVFAISQASAYTCTFTLSPSTVHVGADGTSNFFGVTASNSICSWAAASNNPTALSVNPNRSDGVVFYSVAQNTSTQPRTLTITAGCETFTVIQDGTSASNPVPAITTLQPAGATAGSAAFTVTINGSGFVNGAVVNFNRTAKPTAFVSASQLTAAIAAADISSVGNIPVTVTNPTPRGGTSNTVNFAVSAAAKITPTVTVTPAKPSITTAQPLSVTVTVAGGTGNPTPTGSITLTSGSYASAASALVSGSATINIPAGSLATGTDTLSAAYTPDSSSSATYSNATGSGSVIVTTPTKITPTVTVTPASSSITTKQALNVQITVSGGTGNPTPTGSVTLTSGSYSSTATALSSGKATVSIPAGSLATGTDGLSVAYTPDSSSSATYNSASGSSTVSVTSPTLATPTVTVTPASSSITTTQELNVAIAVSGGSGNPIPTGSVALTSGTYNSGAVTLSSGDANITIPAGSLAVGSDTLAVAYTPDSASSTTYNSASGTGTVTVTAATVKVTVGTTPSGLSFSVDGTTYTASQSLTWTLGSSHTIATTSPQTSAGTQNTFTSWSDGGALSHSVTASSSTTSYIAIFSPAYQLTTGASPSADGSVSPASGSYYPSGTVVNLSATPNAGFQFSNWTGNVASTTSASTTITMNAAQSVMANFSAIPTPAVSLSPSTLTFTTNTGTTSAAQSISLKNTGNAALTIGSIAIVGASPTAFAETDTCGSSLTAGATCSIAITFTPASAASFSATVSVTDNATGSPQSVALSGTGTAPPIPTFTLSSSTATQTITAGGSAQYTITVAAQNGTFPSAVTLSASGLPPGATAAFQPASVSPGSSSATSQLTVQTAATATSTGLRSAWVASLAMLPLFWLLRSTIRHRRGWATLAILMLASLAAVTLSGCGGGFGFGTKPSTSYTITVSGASGATQQTTTVQLIVQ